MMIKSSTLWLLLFLFVLANGQYVGAQENFRLDYFGGEKGLSHGNLTGLMKDRDGFLWIGTWNGINRYDGQRFKTYNTTEQKRHAVASRRIIQMIDGINNDIWFLTYDMKLYRFDKASEEFFSVSEVVESAQNKPVQFNKILAIDAQSVWVGSTDNGLFCIDALDKKYHYSIFSAENKTFRQRLSSNKLTYFYRDAQQQVWIGTREGLHMLQVDPKERNSFRVVQSVDLRSDGIFKIAEAPDFMFFSTLRNKLLVFDKQKKDVEQLTLTEGSINDMRMSRDKKRLFISTSVGELIAFDLAKRVGQTILRFRTGLAGIYEDSRQRLWLESAGNGVVMLDLNHLKSTYFSSPFFKKSSTANFKCFEDAEHRVWINMRGGGFGFFDEQQAVINFSFKAINGKRIDFPRFVHDIVYDPAGVIWFAVEGEGMGAVVFENHGMSFQSFANEQGETTDPEVRSLLFDRQGRLWVGKKFGSIAVFDQGKLLPVSFIGGDPEALSSVYCLLEDRRGTMWMGTKKHGLLMAVPQNKAGTSYKLEQFSTSNKKLGSNQVYTLLEDKQGAIWIGTYGQGLLRATEVNGKPVFEQIAIRKVGLQKDAFSRIRQLSLDEKGMIWVATTYGLLVVNPSRKRDHFYFVHYSGDQVADNDVQYLYKDHSGTMWICTSGGGLTKSYGDPFKGLQFEHYTVKDGLFNDYVLSCIEDADNNLWLGTEGGLSKFDLQKKKFVNLNASDGFGNMRFSEKTVAQRKDGRIVWGTTKGMLWLDTKYFKQKSSRPQLLLTGLLINNKEFVLNPQKKGQETGIQYTDRLILDHNQNNLSFDVSVSDPRHMHPNFQYRIMQVDTTWHLNNQIARITYTNLNPGDYTLEIKGEDDLYDGGPYRKVDFTINAPWWKTGSAYLAYALLLLGVSYGTFRLILQLLRLKQKVLIEQHLSALKMEFFTNISHELRTPLTLILSPVKKLMGEETEGRKQVYMDIIHRNALRMELFVNQLLDLRKVQESKHHLNITQFDMVVLLSDVLLAFMASAEAKQVCFKVETPFKELWVYLDQEKMEIILYNLLSNALKYAPEGSTVEIQLDLRQQKMHIDIADAGPGVPSATLPYIFDLFYSENNNGVHKRKSTGVGLALAKEFALLHQGHIYAANRPDHGLQVTVEIPMPNASGLRGSLTDHLAFDHAKPKAGEYAANGLHKGKTEQQETLLLVEDNADLRLFLQEQLTPYYHVEVAADGCEGLEKTRAILPDFILSDLMMPQMDGIEMLKEVRSDARLCHIPFVLLSAKHAIETQIEGLGYGADYYITKPFEPAFLLTAIANLLQKRKSYFEQVSGQHVPTILATEVQIDDRDKKFLETVVTVVDQHMNQSDFNIDLIAEQLNLARNTFYKKFKSLTDMAPVEFVRQLRLKKAKRYFDAGLENVSEVAYRVGFNNPKYFSTSFKEMFGISPKEYAMQRKDKTL
ncbi:response regulator [Sphingobacterium sp. N143]|uniref:hybrid sensor histidine kinase/response regulator transcription factor n=1 Tax=Sphingobacterium sp. N143 TaxID=2746727 RepID=UPI0025769861|nr:hybrid sensor histidine kinase/response regulator transcription factor [Sphingobacterium sp. N143]MDM1292704.1 response regulator [Sphingobacterium sp. N143]